MFVLLADPTFVPACRQSLQYVCQKSIAEWGTKLSLGAKKGLPAYSASSSTKGVEISKATLLLEK